MNKDKLLFIYPVGNIDGSAAQAEKIIPYLTKEFDVEILDAREYPTLPVGIVKLNMGVPIYLSKRFDDAIMKLKPDVIFLYAFDENIVMKISNARKIWKGKLVWVFGANFTEHFLVHKYFGDKNNLPIILTDFVSIPDLVIAPSMYASELASFLNAKKIAYVPTSIDVDSYTPTIYEGEKFISVGRFQPVNDYFTTLNAFRRIATEFPKTSYRLIGSGTYNSLYIRAIIEYQIEKRVDIFSTNPASYQEKADIALVPTITAMGVNNVVLEAMASGCFTIVSDVKGFGSLNSVIKIPSVDDLIGWYNAMKRVVENKDEAKKIILKQLREVEEYDSKKINPVYPRIIKKILED